LFVNVRPDTANKREFYEILNAQLRSMIEGEYDTVANLANASALLYESLEHINWSGFYLFKNNELVLGPFQGKPACIRIPFGKGVCGTAASCRSTVLVRDVHKFPGHIACDSASESEIVIPIIKNGELTGVMDIDSPVQNRFDEEDRAGLECFAGILERGCNFE
jgi:GAF domain-containing protein